MKNKKRPGLKRVIGLPQATALVVGTIIGASIFVQPSEITGKVPSILGVFLVWLVSGVMTIFGALVCAELSSIFTRSGGVYVFLKDIFSPGLGFLWGWAMFWSMHSGIIAAISMIFARYSAYFIPLNSLGIKAVAMGMILVLSAVNYIGVRQGSLLQTLFTLGKIMAVMAIIVLGFSLGSKVQGHFVTSSIPAKISFQDFLLAIIAGLFAFGGWHMVTYNAEETINAQKTIPRALMLGTVIVTLCYIALNAVYLYVLPLDKVISSTRIAADAADKLLGSGGGAIMSGIVVFSTFGAVSGIVLAGPRVYYSMAQDGLLFRWIGDIHPKYKTPHKAIIVQAIWSSVLVVTGTYRVLFTRVVYTEWVFFGLMAVGLFLLRRRPGIKRFYNIWGYPLVPALFIIASFIVVINQVISDPAESVLGFSLVAVGLPVYFFWSKQIQKRSRDHEIR